MLSISRATRKLRSPTAPLVLDPAVAKEKLKGKGDPKDEKVKKMLEFIPDRPKS